jgi:hypothetical protein
MEALQKSPPPKLARPPYPSYGARLPKPIVPMPTPEALPIAKGGAKPAKKP